MNIKKIYKSLAFAGAILSTSLIAATTISCETDKSKSDKSEKTPKSTERTAEETVLDTVAQNVTLKYDKIEEVLKADFKQEKVVYENYKQDKHVIEFVSNNSEAKDNFVTVTFTVSEIGGTKKSLPVTKELKGFKAPAVPTIYTEDNKKEIRNTLASVLASVDISYPNATETHILSVSRNSVVFSGVDTKIYRTIIESDKSDKTAKNVEFTFRLEHLDSKIKSETRSLKILGFKVDELTTEQELERVLGIVQLGYKNLANVEVTAAKQADVEFTGFDTGKFSVDITKFDIKADTNNVAISYKLIDTATKKESKVTDSSISGFKAIKTA